MIIDCETCVMREIACADCVITVLFTPTSTPADISPAQGQALVALADQGMVPPLRFAQ